LREESKIEKRITLKQEKRNNKQRRVDFRFVYLNSIQKQEKKEIVIKMFHVSFAESSGVSQGAGVYVNFICMASILTSHIFKPKAKSIIFVASISDQKRLSFQLQ
jgi:hypothetical protein